MWGINPITVSKIIAGVGASTLLFGRHGSAQHFSRKMKLYISEQKADVAKAMARSIADQDRSFYEKLKKELKTDLSPEEYDYIFNNT